MPEGKDLDPRTWVVESNTLAREVVYKNINEGGEPSKAYTDAAQQLSRRRLALAGYRLAGVLNALFVPALAKPERFRKVDEAPAGAPTIQRPFHNRNPD